MNWTEKSIAAELALNHFAFRHLVTVPNCNWAGYEADLLVVTKALKVLDFEIKISRADFKADAKKGKWFDTVNAQTSIPVVVYDRRVARRWSYWREQRVSIPRLHPMNIWKHYYVMPEEIYNESLDDLAASPASGILLVCATDNGRVHFREVRKAKANKEYQPITPAQTLDIARLASLRLWGQVRQGEAA